MAIDNVKTKTLLTAACALVACACVPPLARGAEERWTIDYDFDDPACAYLRLDLVSAGRNARWNASFNGTYLPHFRMRPGKYTIPFIGPWTRPPAGPRRGRTRFSPGGEGGEVIDAVRTVGFGATDGVYFEAVCANGRNAAAGDTVRSGDVLRVRMRVESPPDDLSLAFYTVNRSKDWAFIGRWELLEIPGAPIQLKPSAADPLVYTAEFQVPALPKAVSVGRHSLVAAVHYAGSDSRDFGMYYGVSPFAFEFAGGGRRVGNKNYRFYDFGPSDGPVQTGAEAVTQQDCPNGFSWLAKPKEFVIAPHRSMDASMGDWAVASAGRPIRLSVDVPAGVRYKVVVGISSIGVRCFHNGMYWPSLGSVKVNGEKAFEFDPEESNRSLFRFIDRDAELEEDVYDTYMRPYFRDVTFETVAADGRIVLETSLPPDAPKGHKMPLNYLVIYPSDDKTCERTFARQLEIRKIRFNEFWRDTTSGIADLRDPQQVREDEMGNGPLRLFARDNAANWVLPQMRPLRNELNRSLVVSVAPGQKATGVVVFNAAKDARGVELRVEGIPEKAKPRMWRQMHYRFAHGYGHVHKLGANHYMPMRPCDRAAGASHGYALRVDVPEDMAPGEYRGRIVAADADGNKAEIAAVLRVYDVRLPALDDHRIAMLGPQCSTPYGMRTAKEELGCTTATKMVSDMRYGRYEVDASGEIASFRQGGSVEDWERWFRDYLETGFACKEPFFTVGAMGYEHASPAGRIAAFTPAWRKALNAFSNTALKSARAAGLDNLVLDLGGEMGHEAKQPKKKTVDEAVRLFRMLKEEAPEIKISYRCNCYTTVSNFFPLLDVAGVRGAKSWKYADAIGDFGRKMDVYTYSVEGRFLNGLHSWAHGAKGNFREWMTWSHAVNFDDFLCQGDCGGTWHVEMMSGPGGKLIPTLRSEAFRASVDDRRYLRLLENAIGRARDSGERRNAEAFLGLLRRLAYDKTKDSSQPFGYGYARSDGNNPWQAVNLDLMREVCVRFAKALESGGRSGMPVFVLPERNAFRFGLEDGPLVRAGSAAVTVVMNATAAKGAKPVKATARLNGPDGAVLASLDFGENAKCARRVLSTAGFPSGVYTLALFLDGACDSEYSFYVLPPCLQ